MFEPRYLGCYQVLKTAPLQGWAAQFFCLYIWRVQTEGWVWGFMLR